MARRKRSNHYNPFAICTNVAKKEGWKIRGKKWERCVRKVKKEVGWKEKKG